MAFVQVSELNNITWSYLPTSKQNTHRPPIFFTLNALVECGPRENAVESVEQDERAGGARVDPVEKCASLPP